MIRHEANEARPSKNCNINMLKQGVDVHLEIMGRKAHVLAISYPAQGHVRPLLKLSQLIADHGVKVTFVTTEFTHDRITEALPEQKQNLIQMASIPDGLEPEDDRKDWNKLHDSVQRVMPAHLEDLINKINLSCDDEQISCMIVEPVVSWALEIAERMGIKRAMLWASSVQCFALGAHIPKLIETGIIDCDGTPLKNEMVFLSPDLPAMSTADFTWNIPSSLIAQKKAFNYTFSSTRAAKTANWLLCNSFYELEPSACGLVPNLLPVGPLPSNDRPGQSSGSFWPEDSTCLSWLDTKLDRSVIYVAFGSTGIFSHTQFEELALGLELVGHPFLWVVRSDFSDAAIDRYPDGLLERVGDNAKIVRWAPQEKVLAHPSVACFLTHCGWNSTMEGVSMGVPFLCWPYFTDQFHVRNYICDVWKVGLGLKPEENGIISRHEIKRQIESLLSSDTIRANALRLKDMARESISEGGSSLKNFKNFIDQIKG